MLLNQPDCSSQASSLGIHVAKVPADWTEYRLQCNGILLPTSREKNRVKYK